MCRLYGFRANEPTKVECSLVHAQNALLLQSRSDALGREHADGWGLASYRGGDLDIEHRDTAAFEDVHFSAAAERIYATAVVAHVRRATVGAASRWNTHPFRYGRWTFAHNGTVSAFDRLRDEMASRTSPRFQRMRRGTTDSEQTFCWILTELEKGGVDVDSERVDSAHLTALLARAVVALEDWTKSVGGTKPSKLNLLMTNGRIMAASRFNHTLYSLERDGVHDCEICGIPHVHHVEGSAYRAVVLGSEPITHEEWQEVPEHSVVGVDEQLGVHVVALK